MVGTFEVEKQFPTHIEHLITGITHWVQKQNMNIIKIIHMEISKTRTRISVGEFRLVNQYFGLNFVSISSNVWELHSRQWDLDVSHGSATLYSVSGTEMYLNHLHDTASKYSLG